MPNNLNKKSKLKTTNNSTNKEKKILKLYHKVKEWDCPNNNSENFKKDLLLKRKKRTKLNNNGINKLTSKQSKRKKIKGLKKAKLNKKHQNYLKSILISSIARKS